MKKIILVVFMTLLIATGCSVTTATGKYKEGIYYGQTEDTYGGKSNVASAVIYVDNTGNIKSVFVDTTYTTADGKTTTKKALGNDYNMKSTSAKMGNIEGGAEWFEQAKSLENKVVSEQGLDWLKWKDAEQTTTDSVSGVTIKVDALYKAIDNALKQAK